MRKIISLLIALAISIVLVPEAFSQKTEQWEYLLDGGQGSGNLTLTEKLDGTVTAVGDWVYSYQGQNVTGSFSDAPVTIAGSTISVAASGTATNHSLLPQFNTSPFTLDFSGTSINGQGSGTFNMTFTAPLWISGISGNWEGTRTSGSGITAESAAPTADFTADPVSGPIPLDVNFTDQSTGDITSWHWDFGDGSTSTEQDPSHTYTDSGIYTVSLTVTGPGGSDSETKTDFIDVSERQKGMPWIPLLLFSNFAPVANAGTDQNVKTGSLVHLDGSGSTDEDGDTLTYSWSLISIPAGSSATLSDSTGYNPSFTADVEGTYIITLVVNDGKLDSAADQVTVVAPGYILLNYIVSDAEYSKQLNKIIMVSSNPRQLHIYDPVTEENIDIDLPLTPTCVSVSPDGLYAAVGHDGWISYVNLTTAILEKTLSVTTDVLDIVLAGNGYVYAFPKRDQWENIRCVEITTGAETLSTGGSIYAGTLAKLHPSGNAIYGADNGLSPSDIEKYSIVAGTAVYLYDSPYHGDYPMCGDLWVSEDGLRIFTRCGNVFRSSELRGQDMTYNVSLSGLSLIEHLSHSSLANKVIAIPGVDWIDPDDEDTELQIYDYDFLAYEESVSLPSFIDNGNAHPGHGRYVFFNSDGSAYYVVMKADENSGMLYDFGVVTYYR